MKVECITVGPFEVNCYVAWNARPDALVIDPGADAERILDFLDHYGLQVAVYLLTHGHADHVSALAPLHRARPAPIAMHPLDQRWAFGPDNQIPPYYAVPDAPERVARPMREGQRWEDAGLAYEVIETPGHTPGGVCLYLPLEKTLFAGDTLFRGSVGRTDRPGASARVLTESLRKLARLPDDVVVYPGHGPATTIGEEKRNNVFLRSAV
jgi:glyoxylase-like metal-dependent hydrolase (beta-lactamase superfamily II)